jgi:hypothetical protein
MTSDDVQCTVLIVKCVLFVWWLNARGQFFNFVARNMCMRFVTVIFAFAGENISDQSDSGNYELGGDLLFGIEYFDGEVKVENFVQARSCVVATTKLTLLLMSLLVCRRKTQITK